MTSIHPIAYITIGTVVAGYSKFVQWRSGNSYLEAFFWVGLIFLVVGLIKLAFRRMNKESKRKVEKLEHNVNNMEKQFQQQRPFNTYDPSRDQRKNF